MTQRLQLFGRRAPVSAASWVAGALCVAVLGFSAPARAGGPEAEAQSGAQQNAAYPAPEKARDYLDTFMNWLGVPSAANYTAQPAWWQSPNWRQFKTAEKAQAIADKRAREKHAAGYYRATVLILGACSPRSVYNVYLEAENIHQAVAYNFNLWTGRMYLYFDPGYKPTVEGLHDMLEGSGWTVPTKRIKLDFIRVSPETAHAPASTGENGNRSEQARGAAPQR